MRFIDTASGKELTVQNVDDDASDDIDSDAEDLGGGISEIQAIEVLAGQDTPDNDAGVVYPAEFATEKDLVSTDDEPETLRCAITSNWPKGADGGHKA